MSKSWPWSSLSSLSSSSNLKLAVVSQRTTKNCIKMKNARDTASYSDNLGKYDFANGYYVNQSNYVELTNVRLKGTRFSKPQTKYVLVV